MANGNVIMRPLAKTDLIITKTKNMGTVTRAAKNLAYDVLK